MSKHVWEIGLENLTAAYEAAQLKQAQEFLADIEDDQDNVVLYDVPDEIPIFDLVQLSPRILEILES